MSLPVLIPSTPSLRDATSPRIERVGAGLSLRLAFLRDVVMVDDMKEDAERVSVMTTDSSHVPSHVPSGAVLLALELNEQARGMTGLDVLRRSVDRAPPA